MAKKSLIWAINPFQKNPKLLKKVLTYLRHLGGRFAIEPCYVVTPTEVNAALEFSLLAKDRFHTVAQREMDKALKGLVFPGKAKGTVLVEGDLGASASARRLSHFARRRGAAAIVLATHGREGLARFLMGSFAETLLAESKVPLILVNPRFKQATPLKTALFATDFSAASKRAFSQFCEYVAPFRPKLQLFHVLPTPFPWASMATEFLWGGEAVSVGEYIKLLGSIRQNEAKPFASIARRAGLELQVVIEPSGEDVGGVILRKAKASKAQIIGMAAQTGRLKTALLGAASRVVLREAEIPVWVQRV